MNRGEKRKVLSIKIEFDTTSIETFIQSQEVKSSSTSWNILSLQLKTV